MLRESPLLRSVGVAAPLICLSATIRTISRGSGNHRPERGLRCRVTMREELMSGRLSETTEMRAAIASALSHCTDPALLQQVLQLLRNADENGGILMVRLLT
jgi:hypothetical protein